MKLLIKKLVKETRRFNSKLLKMRIEGSKLETWMMNKWKFSFLINNS